LATSQGIAVEGCPFTLAEAKSAREAFLTSTTTFVLPVARIDETVLGNGRPGSQTLTLRQLYLDFMADVAAKPG
jgi:D-alanine transaminase